MTTDEYLTKVLESQTLTDDSKEIKEIRKHREDVESLLRDKYGSSPRIRYGGSKAKGTMIRESYDLDIHCYFSHDDTVAGDTLEDIFKDVAAALEKGYRVEPKRSALRLTSKQPTTRGVYLHIDVVPGRFINDNEDYVFLYQNEGDKQRLQTNLDVHIAHIRDSGVTDAIRLLKLWKVRNGLVQVKTFILELLVVDLLKEHRKVGLAEQLGIVLEIFRDRIDDLSVEDPANPDGNNLSRMLDESCYSLSSTATLTLQTVDQSGWEAVFGRTEETSDDDKRQRLQSIAVSIAPASRTKPWWS
jgi:hypothetical protein